MVPPGHFRGPGPNNQSRPPMGQMGSGTMPPGHFPGPGHINPSLAPMSQMGSGMIPPYPSQHPSHHLFGLGAHPASGPGPRYMIRSLVGQVMPPSFSTSQVTSSNEKNDKEVKDLIITVSVFEVLTIIAIIIFMIFNQHANPVGDDFFYRPFSYFFSFWFILLFILNTVYTVKLSNSMKYKKNGGAIFLTSITYVTLLVLFFIILRCRSRLTPIKRKTPVTSVLL